jgi:REP element-mobilizing transposase RayT
LINSIIHSREFRINRQSIFESDEDCTRFLEIISEVKNLSGFKLPGYCLMGNHAHLLIQTAEEPLSVVFNRIGVRYVSWFNRKYERSGHLFQDRFKSEAIDDDKRLLAVLRYIFNNPVKARICRQAADYKWSSYRDYISQGKGLTDTSDILQMFSTNASNAIEQFKGFMQIEAEGVFLDADSASKRSDEAYRERMEKLCGIKTSGQFQALTPEERDRSIRILRESGMSIRRISRLTGISIGIVRSR